MRNQFSPSPNNLRVAMSVSNSRGQGLAEYLIIVVLVAVIVIFGIRYFGSSVTNQLQNATELIENPEDAVRVDSTRGHSTASKNSETTSGTQTSDGSRERINSEQSTQTTDSIKVDERAQKIDALSRGVGDDPNALESVELDWGTLLIIAAVVCSVGFLIIFMMVKKNKGQKGGKQSKVNNKKGKGQAGQAMVEFVFIVITFLFVILGILQLAMCLNAYALVRYAAFNAARAAIVHQGDPQKMHEAARLSLIATFPKHGRADHRRGFMENYLAAMATDQNPLLTFYFEPITQVRIINPPNNILTFDDTLRADDGIVTVEVKHLYEMVVPLVNRILFRVYQMWRGSGYDGRSLMALSAETDAMRRTGAYRDIEYRIPLVAHYTMRMQSDYQP